MTARERGSASLELALLTPPLLMLIMLVVFAGRLANTKTAVISVAKDAARAASLRDDPVAAASAAAVLARQSLADRTITCASPRIETDTSRFGPGGSVQVRITCVASLADLTLLGVPGSTTITAIATEPIDQYRSSR